MPFQKPTLITIPTLRGPSPLGSIPLLGKAPNQKYLGRVIVEVWGEDAQFSCQQISGPESVMQRAVDALLGDPAKFSKISPLPDSPMLGDVNGQSFKGRILVEVWDSDSNVAVLGSEAASDTVTIALRVIGRELSVQTACH